MFQSITVCGNLTRDPETKTVGNGKTMCRFAVAVNKKINGDQVTTFFDVVTWEKQAEIAQRFLKKGSPVLLRGEMQRREHQPDDGGPKRIYWDLSAQEVRLMPDGNRGAGSSPRQEGASGDDIPF